MKAGPDLPRPAFIRLAVLASLLVTGVRVPAGPPVTCLQFSNDGQTLLIGFQNGLEVRSAPFTQPQTVRFPTRFHLFDVLLSADESRVLLCGGVPGEATDVLCLRWPGLQLLWEQRFEPDVGYSVAWAVDQSLVAIGGHDAGLRLLSATDGQLRQLWKGHSRPVVAAEKLTEKLLLTGGLDHSLRVWELPTGRQIRSLNNHRRAVTGLDVHRPVNGLPIAVSVSEDRTLRIWQPTIGRLVRFVKLDSVPDCVAISSDCETAFAGCRDGSVVQVDLESLAVQSVASGFPTGATAVAVTTDQQLAVGFASGKVRVFERR